MADDLPAEQRGGAPKTRTDSTATATSPPASRKPGDPGASALSLYLGAGAAVVLLVVVVVALMLQSHQQQAAVKGLQWQEACTFVRAHYQAGDVVRIAPVWADDPRVFLDDMAVDLTPTPQPDVLEAYDRIWVIAAEGRGEGVVTEMPEHYQLTRREALGRAEVLLFAVPKSAKPLYDFVEKISQAKVSRSFPKKPTQRCTTWRDGAWHCAKVDKHLYVGVEARDMDGQPRRCIYMPPIADDGWVEVSFGRVPLGVRLEGHVGFDNLAVRMKRGGVTDFAVVVNGQELMSMRLDPHDPTLHAFSLDTSSLQGQQGTVVFKAHAKDFYDRFLCVAARVPGPGGD